MGHLFKRFSRDITGLIWLSTGIFLTLSLFSYHPTDPSLNSIGNSVKVQNYCGYFGSFLADICYQMLGLSSWLLILGAARKAWFAFKGADSKKTHQLAGVWACLALATCASLLSLYWPTKAVFAGQVPVGGLIGGMISKLLIGVFNHAGVGVILWTTAAVLVVFFTEKSIKELVLWPFEKAIVQNLFGFIKRFFVTTGRSVSEAAKKIKIPSAEPLYATAQPSTETGTKRFFPIDGRSSAASEKNTEATEEAVETIIGEDGQVEYKETAAPERAPKKRQISMRKKVERRIENWELPKISILDDPPYNRKKVEASEIRDKAQRLVNKMKHFGIEGEVVAAKPGPAVTMFEFKPNADVKISRITDLADDLSLELSSESVRIIAPIPGRDVVGIETSNANRETVYLKEILASEEFWDEKVSLPLAVGCEVDGTQKVVDLRKMPHMMVAGTTGSGKSVFVVSLLTGLLFRHSPKTLRLILIDPKQVDLAVFSNVPHLLMPPIREPQKAINALKWAIREMEKRYRSMAKFGARDLESFNDKVSKLSSEQIAEHDAINNPTEPVPGQQQQSYYFQPQPYTVIVVEEFGDLMAVDKSNVENCVVRLAQMARACGLHLILAMQSPRKEVVTGLIKTNIPGRVSFKVASKMDSRIILDESGAERLLSRGDMLFLAPGVSKPHRHHGPWIADGEIQEVANFWTAQAEPEFDSTALKALEGSGGGYGDGMDAGGDGMGGDSEFDDRYDEILAYVSTLKEISASHIQTRFRLGYPRAARLIEVFEQQGVVGPASGSKKRQVLINELK